MVPKGNTYKFLVIICHKLASVAETPNQMAVSGGISNEIRRERLKQAGAHEVDGFFFAICHLMNQETPQKKEAHFEQGLSLVRSIVAKLRTRDSRSRGAGELRFVGCPSLAGVKGQTKNREAPYHLKLHQQVDLLLPRKTDSSRCFLARPVDFQSFPFAATSIVDACRCRSLGVGPTPFFPLLLVNCAVRDA